MPPIRSPVVHRRSGKKNFPQKSTPKGSESMQVNQFDDKA